MATKAVAALILAAGRGERMNSEFPKVLHKAAGLPLLEHVMEVVRKVGIARVAVVIGAQSEAFRSLLNGASIVLQRKRLGTAHAVLQARRQFGNWKGDLLVLPADAPCIRTKTLCDLIREHRRNQASASVLTAEVENPTGYGRILRDRDHVFGIREELDATETERRISEVNSGIY